MIEVNTLELKGDSQPEESKKAESEGEDPAFTTSEKKKLDVVPLSISSLEFKPTEPPKVKKEEPLPQQPVLVPFPFQIMNLYKTQNLPPRIQKHQMKNYSAKFLENMAEGINIVDFKQLQKEMNQEMSKEEEDIII